MLPTVARRPIRAAVEISRDELDASRWDYVALGHYHVYREIAPNAFYCGSIDYTSVNTWGELYEERDGRSDGQGIHRARPRHRRAHVSLAAARRVRSSICRRSTRAD